jgi:hypothetical protein
MKPVIFIFIIFLFLSCSRDRHSHLPAKYQRFVHVYTELLKLKEKNISPQEAYIDSSIAVLHKYQYTQEEYDQTLAYFNKKPKRWKVFYEEVLEQLKRDNASTSPQHKKHQ